jgi:hypothetical protein
MRSISSGGGSRCSSTLASRRPARHADCAFELLQTLCQAARFDAWTAQLSA